MATAGFCHGHQYPDAGITPVSFAGWEKYPSAHVASDVTGDADWGAVIQEYASQDVSPVMDTGLTAEMTFTVRHSYYGSYWYGGRVWIRGSLSPFDIQATPGDLAWEEVKTSTLVKTWRYVQFLIDDSVPPTPTPTPTSTTPEPTIA
jgi:hypothetical protein